MSKSSKIVPWIVVAATITIALIYAHVSKGSFSGSSGSSTLAGHVVVTSYGASGLPQSLTTGDDSEAFSDALATMAAEYDGAVLTRFGGGLLEIPVGIYYLPELLPIIGPIKIVGQGRSNIGTWTSGTVLYSTYTSSTRGHTGVLFTGRGITVESITFRADQTSPTGSLPGTLVHVVNCEFAYFKDCDFYLNRVDGTDGDNLYAALVVDQTSATGRTTHITFEGCNFFCPRRKNDGTGGIGYGTIVRNSSNDPASITSDISFIRCTWSNSAKGSRAILVAGADSVGFRGPCNGNRFYGCHIGGNSGIEFCSSHRNEYSGAIDLVAALGDTAVFNTLGATNNYVTGTLDGHKYDESVNPNYRLQINDRSNQGGPLYRGIQLARRSASQLANDVTGAPVNPGTIIYDYDAGSATGRVKLKIEDGSWVEMATVDDLGG